MLFLHFSPDNFNETNSLNEARKTELNKEYVVYKDYPKKEKIFSKKPLKKANKAYRFFRRRTSEMINYEETEIYSENPGDLLKANKFPDYAIISGMFNSIEIFQDFQTGISGFADCIGEFQCGEIRENQEQNPSNSPKACSRSRGDERTEGNKKEDANFQIRIAEKRPSAHRGKFPGNRIRSTIRTGKSSHAGNERPEKYTVIIETIAEGRARRKTLAGKTEGLFAECKFRNECAGMDVLFLLKDRASNVRGFDSKEYIIFSKAGFSDELKTAAEREGVLLVELDEMFEEKKI